MNFLKMFGHVFAYFWAPCAPQGRQNGPRDPGDQLKIKKTIFVQKFGPEVSTIFDILSFGFWGVFSWILILVQLFLTFYPWGGWAPPDLLASWGLRPPPLWAPNLESKSGAQSGAPSLGPQIWGPNSGAQV